MDKNLTPGQIGPEKPSTEAPTRSPEIFGVPSEDQSQNKKKEARKDLITPEIVIEESPRGNEVEEEEPKEVKINLPEISSVDVEEKPINTVDQAARLQDELNNALK